MDICGVNKLGKDNLLSATRAIAAHKHQEIVKNMSHPPFLFILLPEERRTRVSRPPPADRADFIQAVIRVPCHSAAA